jgi:hypothetical protein
MPHNTGSGALISPGLPGCRRSEITGDLGRGLKLVDPYIVGDRAHLMPGSAAVGEHDPCWLAAGLSARLGRLGKTADTSGWSFVA